MCIRREKKSHISTSERYMCAKELYMDVQECTMFGDAGMVSFSGICELCHIYEGVMSHV